MKRIKLIIFTLIISFFAVNSIDAASASITVTSNKSTVMVGETVTVTVKISSSNALGSWRFDVVPSSNLTLTNSSFGGMYIVDYGNSTTKSKTYTFTFKAKSSGTGKVQIKNSEVFGYDELSMSTTNGSTSFKMITYAQLQESYSKNNYLSSLSIEGYNISPTFNKDTLEYTLEVENGVTSVKVNATKEDSKASVSGTGTINVSEGVNPIKVVVTAQNGSTKTYTINVTVKELKPINVTLDGKDYTVIRKVEAMPTASLYFKASTVLIGEEEVPCYINETINFTLVGLKDSEGNSTLFLYKDGNYEKYSEYSFNQLSIYMLELEQSMIPEGYVETTIRIGDTAVKAYKCENSNYPLIYGMNIETGEKSLYRFDDKENTIQRHEEVFDKEKQIYFYAAVGLFGLLILTYIGIIIGLIVNSKKKKKKLEQTLKIEKISNNINEVKKEDIKPSKKEIKKKEKKKEQENLLGKTMIDITGIDFDENKKS